MQEITKTPLTPKQLSFTEHYTDSGNKETFGNATESARQANYRGNDGTLQSIGAENLLKPVIRAELARIKADKEVVTEHNRETSLIRLDKAYTLAEKQGNTSSMIAAEREKNAISGLHSQTIYNPDADQAKIMTDEDRQALIAAAGLLTKPKPTIKLHTA